MVVLGYIFLVLLALVVLTLLGLVLMSVPDIRKYLRNARM